MAATQLEAGRICLDLEKGSEQCEDSAPCFHAKNVGNYSSRCQRTVKFPLQQVWLVVYKKQKQEWSLWETAEGGEGQGRAIVRADSEQMLCGEGLNPLNDFYAHAVGS